MELVRNATNSRHMASQAEGNTGVINVSDEWWQRLNGIPFASCKYPMMSNIIST